MNNMAFQFISSIFPLPLATFIPILSHFSFHLFLITKMSFRELRDATEILRALGYPRLVSMENFRFPNFPLMAEILEWTVKKFDPNARFPKQLDSEQDRLIFVKSAVLILLQKAHIRLNPKNIYQSDGHAIRELLPLLKMLYEGRHDGEGIGQNGKGEEDFNSLGINALRAQLNAKRQQLRQGVQLAGELPKSGANLYELLRDEIFAKETRNRALGQSLNATQVEKEIKERIRETEQKIGEFKQRLENIGNDEQEMAKKVERRRRELDQLQKRLAKLQSFRPPYMDEYERYEHELKAHYEIYVVLFRNLHYLQQQLAQAENAEREQAVNAEHSMRVAVEKMRMEREEESPTAIAGINKEGGGILFEDEDELKPSKIRVFGNMTGTGISDDEEEDEDEGRIIEVEDDDEEEEEDDQNGEGGFRRGMEEEDKTFINDDDDDEHAESVGEEENHAANDL